jgi:hypothetical protein
MKTKEEIEQLADKAINKEGYTTDDFIIGFEQGYTQCQEDMAEEPFNNFYLRLKEFVSNVQVNDPMSEEEKEMIIYVCNKQLNKQD